MSSYSNPKSKKYRQSIKEEMTKESHNYKTELLKNYLVKQPE